MLHYKYGVVGGGKIQIKRNRSIVALTAFLMLSFAFYSVQATSIKKVQQENNDILTVDLGSMKMEYVDDPDQNFIDISFDNPSTISDTIFKIGQTIRLQVNWEIIEGGSRQDYWNFSIERVSLDYGCGSWATITPENEKGWYNDTNDRWGRNDDSQGILYFDFTPTREWFCNAWHNIGGDEYNDPDEHTSTIVLKCEYKNKRWISNKWNTTTQEEKLKDNWYIEYENTAPTITDHEISKDGKKVTIDMDVEDPDFKSSSGKGDNIGVTINWGDGTTTDTGFWDDKDQIMNGETTVSKTHTYENKGTYTITAKVKDWYNSGFHEYSNEISDEVEVKKKSDIDYGFFPDFLKYFPFFEKVLDFFEKINIKNILER